MAEFHCEDPDCDRCFADALDYEMYGNPAPVAELLGADPDYLGGQSVDDYIREARR